MLTRADLQLYQGDDWNLLVNVTNPDGSPGDITGWTARAVIRRGNADNHPIEATMSATVTPPDLVQLAVSHGVTASMKGVYAWDLELITSAGTITTILFGAIEVIPEVTRA